MFIFIKNGVKNEGTKFERGARKRYHIIGLYLYKLNTGISSMETTNDLYKTPIFFGTTQSRSKKF